ncbi:MAG: N-acetylmuramoyl-L-alanine amidase [Verrucomicrobiales bacterium]|nr:N-acetylmuramoyl-L-alanine amidase [Verrucomicrobiales bacterium]
MKKAIPFIISLAIFLGLLVLTVVLRAPKPELGEKEKPADPDPPLAPLVHPPRGFEPDWEALNAYHGTISADELRTLIEDVYTVDDTWMQVIAIEGDRATVQTSGVPFVLRLREGGATAPVEVPRYWRSGISLREMHIAIDPGHIGGDFARIEERHFGRPQDRPVREGELTLMTAKRLKPILEEMGARVSLVRDSNAPVTAKRAADFLNLYQEYNPGWPDAMLQPYANGRFYRREEIVERARVVNEDLKPDLVLCLHYNASSGSGAWSSPDKPVFVEENHFHLLLNGAYTVGEVLDEGDRFQMMERILQRIHEEEAAVGAVVADVFAERTGLEPYSYDPESKRARNVDGHSYLWARNLLANRSYTCPVIFFEPWVMNNTDAYAWIQEGDYEGERIVNGRSRPSIMREYAEAVAAGLAAYFER